MNDALFKGRCERFVSRLGVLMSEQLRVCRDQYPDKQGAYLCLAIDHPSDTITLVLSCRLSDNRADVETVESCALAVRDAVVAASGAPPVHSDFTWEGMKTRHG